MRCTHLAALLVVALAPLSASAQQKAAQKPVKSIAVAFEHEQKVWNALKAGDMTAFNKLVDGPFTYIDPAGMYAWKPEDSEAHWKDCKLTSFDTDDAQTQHPAGGMVILSYKAMIDQTCGGVKAPSPIYVLSVWQKKGAAWKLIAHSETATAPAK